MLKNFLGHEHHGTTASVDLRSDTVTQPTPAMRASHVARPFG